MDVAEHVAHSFRCHCDIDIWQLLLTLERAAQGAAPGQARVGQSGAIVPLKRMTWTSVCGSGSPVHLQLSGSCDAIRMHTVLEDSLPHPS